MFNRVQVLSATIALAAMAACGGGAHDPAPAPSTDAGVATQVSPLGEVVSIDQIAVYQAVKVSLVSNGETTPPNAPVIAQRPALVRVHAAIPPRTKVPRLTAELRVRAPGQPDVVLTRGPSALTKFNEGDLSSTFNFDLAAEQVAKGAELSVEIRDPSGVDPSVIRYPAESGDLSMNVGPLAPKLKVKFVPIKYEADGSDRVPSMDALAIEPYRQALYKMYPVSEVEITVRDVVAWPLEVRGDGAGWDQLLQAVIETRRDDEVADDVYYVGVFTPAASAVDYCATDGGCVLGVAPAGSFGDDASLRAAMIVGYNSERQHGTLAQELAHAMGRKHAPCGRPAAIDLKYPYQEANIGVWGWDIVKSELIDPGDYVYDFMSYCSPVWISDYTYAGLYDRMVAVDKTKHPGARVPMKTYYVSKEGKVRAGPTIPIAAEASDEMVLEDAAHATVGKVRGSFRPLSGIGGGLLVTPVEIPAATLKRARFARALAP